MEKNNYFTCYFDILGTKNRDQKTAFDEMLTTSHCFVKYGDNQDIIRRSFSDNFLIALNNKYGIKGLSSVVNNIAMTYCLTLLDNKILIRGAITEGELYISNTVVLGDALLEAYYLENNVSIFPRIVISNSISIKKGTNYKDWFIVDQDGITFLNCFKAIDQKLLQIRYPNIMSTLNDMEHKLLSNSMIKEAAKVHWLINYASKYYEANFK